MSAAIQSNVSYNITGSSFPTILAHASCKWIIFRLFWKLTLHNLACAAVEMTRKNVCMWIFGGTSSPSPLFLLYSNNFILCVWYSTGQNILTFISCTKIRKGKLWFRVEYSIAIGSILQMPFKCFKYHFISRSVYNSEIRLAHQLYSVRCQPASACLS